MAQAPGHKFGQIIGDTLEAAILPSLQEIANTYNLYLDHKHSRPARNGKKKVTWKDDKGNVHDLDYVLEEAGSETQIGKPRAFIEIAWRRYTKHSRNKAQEIQGAIAPLAQTYHDCHPFLGVVLAGVFTAASLTQLESHGFHVLYYSYDTIVEAFRTAAIDARFGEDTPDNEMKQKIDAYNALSPMDKDRITSALRTLRQDQLATFLTSLRTTLDRKVKSIHILPLYGSTTELPSVKEAIAFLQNYQETRPDSEFIKYELNIRYTNRDEIRATFRDKRSAINFLTKCGHNATF